MRVITFGSFDLFHIGHLRILERAKQHGGYLIVGVSSDELNFKKKGFFPVFSAEERLSIVSMIKSVDEVFIEESLEEKRNYITSFSADVLIMGDDWKGKFDSLNDICKIKYLSRTPDISTTKLKERIKYPI